MSAENKFKIGDRVECISSDLSPLVLGAMYTVCGVSKHYVGVEGVSGNDVGWGLNRFKLVARPTPQIPMRVDLTKMESVVESLTRHTVEHTGGSSSYYSTKVAYPLNVEQEAYTAECEDIAEALQMTPAEYNVFKSTWRKAAARQGKKKKGNNAVYDAEKCVFYSGRMLVAAKREVV
jgi:hypothetical protein